MSDNEYSVITSDIIVLTVSADFMKVAGFVEYCFNNTSFTAMNKASNIAMPVSLFINFHKLRCPVNNNY